MQPCLCVQLFNSVLEDVIVTVVCLLVHVLCVQSYRDLSVPLQYVYVHVFLCVELFNSAVEEVIVVCLLACALCTELHVCTCVYGSVDGHRWSLVI